MSFWNEGSRALYVHGDGREEEVTIKAHHPECDALTVFVPSLNRERQTTEARLKPLTLGEPSTSVIDNANNGEEFKRSPPEGGAAATISSVATMGTPAAIATQAIPAAHATPTPLAASSGGSSGGRSESGDGRMAVGEARAYPTAAPIAKPVSRGAAGQWPGAHAQSLKPSPHSWDSAADQREPSRRKTKRVASTAPSDSGKKSGGRDGHRGQRAGLDAPPAPPSVYSYHMSMPQAMPQVDTVYGHGGLRGAGVYNDIDAGVVAAAPHQGQRSYLRDEEGSVATGGGTVFHDLGMDKFDYEDAEGNKIDTSARRIKVGVRVGDLKSPRSTCSYISPTPFHPVKLESALRWNIRDSWHCECYDGFKWERRFDRSK